MGINIIIIIIIIVVVVISIGIAIIIPMVYILGRYRSGTATKESAGDSVEGGSQNHEEPGRTHGKSWTIITEPVKFMQNCCNMLSAFFFFDPIEKNTIRSEHARYLRIEHHFFFANPRKSPSFWPGLWKPRKERRHRGCAWGISMLSFRDVSSVAS